MLEGRPLKGYDLERLKEFLKSMDLDYDMGIEYSICLEDEDYRIIAAGSVEENVLKCIAISPDHQGEGLSGAILFPNNSRSRRQFAFPASAFSFIK